MLVTKVNRKEKKVKVYHFGAYTFLTFLFNAVTGSCYA